jgi:NAD(P)-dependent dehydrogenase (short-subunit alcohol dehydrogenase family)
MGIRRRYLRRGPMDLKDKVAIVTGGARGIGMEALVAGAIRRHGRVDILVNNAGALGIGKPLETTDELWERMQAINLKSAF